MIPWQFGERSRFAIEVGEVIDTAGATRIVDVWAAGRWLTCDDNSVFVPQFAGKLASAVSELLDDHPFASTRRPYPQLSPAEVHRKFCSDAKVDNGESLAHRFMDWGPTADNVLMHLLREGGVASLPFSFRRADHHDPAESGQVFVAELPERELTKILHEAGRAIMCEWADRSKWGAKG